MKKLFILFISIATLTSLYAAPSKVNPEIKFIKGNIQDKIASVKEDDKENTYGIAIKALDFVIENIELLKDDRELAGLAIAAVYAYPESEYLDNTKITLNKFGSVYYSFKDQNVKLSVLDKILLLSKTEVKHEAVTFVNTYVQAAAEDKLKLSEVEKKAVMVLSQIGNHESFRILYNILKADVWTEISNDIKISLLGLTDKSMKDIIAIIKGSDFSEMKRVYSIFVENSNISSTLKSEIAENLLNNSMILIRDSSKISAELSAFQLNNCRILYENNWTRSSALMLSYFEVAKSEYNADFLTAKEFADVISYIEKLSSKDSVKVLTAYLGDLNKEMDNGNLPANSIVSAVIQALGALGDKSAFDCLLYTTYLNYPEEIVAQARSALSSLKW